MDNWDEAAADAAVTGLARTAGADEIFEIFCRFGARDFRDIGHKAIYVANSWRTLQVIGWQHAEPVLRSLAYALLDRGGDPNPARADLDADRPWRRNQSVAGKIRAGLAGRAAKFLRQHRTAPGLAPGFAGRRVRKSRGVAQPAASRHNPSGTRSSSAAGEMLMRRPGILSLHALTCTNALHFAFQTSSQR